MMPSGHYGDTHSMHGFLERSSHIEQDMSLGLPILLVDGGFTEVYLMLAVVLKSGTLLTASIDAPLQP
jgi:hypothetical protein